MFGAFGVFAALLSATQLVDACPMCKEALADPAQAGTASRAAHAYAVSIAALLGIPAASVIGVATMIIRSARRASKST